MSFDLFQNLIKIMTVVEKLKPFLGFPILKYWSYIFELMYVSKLHVSKFLLLSISFFEFIGNAG